MKRLFLTLLVALVGVLLHGCDREEEYIHNVPRENPINRQELPYAEYLSLRNPEVTITLDGIGEMVIQLFPDVAPITVDNYLRYVLDGAYDDNEFHYIVTGLLIQAGKLDNAACPIPGEMSANGFDNPLSHFRGVIAMSKTEGNYNESTSEFFVVPNDTLVLDGEYAAFGGLVSGFNVLDYLVSLESDSTMHPLIPITITTVSVELNGYVPQERQCYIEEQ